MSWAKLHVGWRSFLAEAAMDLTKMSEDELLAYCKAHTGEYLAAHHPSTSFATQYSNQFVAASAELVIRYNRNPHGVVDFLHSAFQRAGVRSCRGGPMTKSKVQYLVSNRVSAVIRERRSLGP